MKNIIFIILSVCFTYNISIAARPFVEYEKVKYVSFSADTTYQTHNLKRDLIKFRVKDITYLVYGDSQRQLDEFKDLVKDLFTSMEEFHKTIKLIPVKGYGEILWAQDALPQAKLTSTGYKLVDSRYYDGFEPDETVAQYFQLPLEKSNFTFEHGNLISTSKGDCYIVNEIFAESIPDSDFKTAFGCKEVTRLKFKYGIGHADEVIKFLSDDIVLTVDKEWASMLRKKGYTVYLLPTPPAAPPWAMQKLRSYANALIVNGTAFVPTFGDKTIDDSALKVYEKAGYKAIGLESSYVVDVAGGGPHCLTKVYPDFTKDD